MATRYIPPSRKTRHGSRHQLAFTKTAKVGQVPDQEPPSPTNNDSSQTNLTTSQQNQSQQQPQQKSNSENPHDSKDAQIAQGRSQRSVVTTIDDEHDNPDYDNISIAESRNIAASLVATSHLPEDFMSADQHPQQQLPTTTTTTPTTVDHYNLFVLGAKGIGKTKLIERLLMHSYSDVPYDFQSGSISTTVTTSQHDTTSVYSATTGSATTDENGTLIVDFDHPDEQMYTIYNHVMISHGEPLELRIHDISYSFFDNLLFFETLFKRHEGKYILSPESSTLCPAPNLIMLCYDCTDVSTLLYLNSLRGYLLRWFYEAHPTIQRLPRPLSPQALQRRLPMVLIGTKGDVIYHCNPRTQKFHLTSQHAVASASAVAAVAAATSGLNTPGSALGVAHHPTSPGHKGIPPTALLPTSLGAASTGYTTALPGSSSKKPLQQSQLSHPHAAPTHISQSLVVGSVSSAVRPMAFTTAPVTGAAAAAGGTTHSYVQSAHASSHLTSFPLAQTASVTSSMSHLITPGSVPPQPLGRTGSGLSVSGSNNHGLTSGSGGGGGGYKPIIPGAIPMAAPQHPTLHRQSSHASASYHGSSYMSQVSGSSHAYVPPTGINPSFAVSSTMRSTALPNSAVSYDTAEAYAAQWNLSLIETSAKFDIDCGGVFATLSNAIIEAREYYMVQTQRKQQRRHEQFVSGRLGVGYRSSQNYHMDEASGIPVTASLLREDSHDFTSFSNNAGYSNEHHQGQTQSTLQYLWSLIGGGGNTSATTQPQLQNKRVTAAALASAHIAALGQQQQQQPPPHSSQFTDDYIFSLSDQESIMGDDDAPTSTTTTSPYGSGLAHNSTPNMGLASSRYSINSPSSSSDAANQHATASWWSYFVCFRGFGSTQRATGDWDDNNMFSTIRRDGTSHDPHQQYQDDEYDEEIGLLHAVRRLPEHSSPNDVAQPPPVVPQTSASTCIIM